MITKSVILCRLQSRYAIIRAMDTITITQIKARQILDSRGNPTVEADVRLSDGSFGRAAVPSGASTGTYEAVELRDGGAEYGGKSVEKAVANVNTIIARELIGMSPFNQQSIDDKMITLDGTPNKGNLGANAILAVSLAVAKASSVSKHLELFEYVNQLAGSTRMSLPMPMINVMNGGQHALGSTDIQEYMIVPIGAGSFADAMRMSAEVFHTLAKVLKSNGYQTTVGDEGGYAPKVKNGNFEPVQLISSAINDAGYRLGSDFALALDVASSEFFENGTYNLSTEGKVLDTAGMIDMYREMIANYPVVSIEDGLDEEAWDDWKELNTAIGNTTQLVGDDLFVTNVTRLQRGIDAGSANSILIKPNQIGTLSETIKAVLLAKQSGMTTVMSHRSGETEDVTIAHLAVGLGTGQIKTGSMSRSERIAKYNELTRIAEAHPQLALDHPFAKS